jgi:glycogen operon protein
VDFTVFSKHATLIELLLFDHGDAVEPAQIIPLSPDKHRRYHYWQTHIPGIRPGQVYGYRAHGPFAPERGLRFDGDKLLLDPYGAAVAVPAGYDRRAAASCGSNIASAMKSVVVEPNGYDWQGDVPLARPFAELVIYEMHVGAFTQHPSSGVVPEKRGTYAGVVEKISYLKDLGVTAVELLPVFQYDPQAAPDGRVNYWGYQPVSFFAPHHAFSSCRDPLDVLDEFRDMVRALHRAGIEVILDAVYNHTGEGPAGGPTLCFRGLANDFYYILERDKARYADFSGCGNTLNANQSIVRRLIQDSLRYWVTEMHVDGFRFDLASILSRDESGAPVPNPPILWDIESDPVLIGTKLIAEAWDAAGLYQVGGFVGERWQEWNGRFRDDARRFLKADDNSVRAIAARILGSPDLYGHEEREPEQSINFVTCHDGFTLNDLVSYNQKHNEANGDDNRDGSNDNLSWNCGAEGPTDDPEVESLRNRQVKNFITLTLLAAGTPMLLMGDEVRRTQNGNNNAYCQDGAVSWFDWSLLERHGDVHRFVRLLTEFRQRRDVVGESALTLNELIRRARLEWHGVALGHPDWSPSSHSIAFTLQTLRSTFRLHGMLNAYWEPLTFELPLGPDGHRGWRRCIDTFLPSPHDIQRWQDAPAVATSRYTVQPRSVVVLAMALTGDPARD